tara:strand:+ start:227 stop:583 length:357 start_codon:yes stop_codon:yes gene_type:complete
MKERKPKLISNPSAILKRAEINRCLKKLSENPYFVKLNKLTSELEADKAHTLAYVNKNIVYKNEKISVNKDSKIELLNDDTKAIYMGWTGKLTKVSSTTVKAYFRNGYLKKDWSGLKS